MSKRKVWSEADVLTACIVYKHMKEGELSRLNMSELVEQTGATESSLKMAAMNFKYLDTGKGLKNYSKLQKNVYDKFWNTINITF